MRGQDGLGKIEVHIDSSCENCGEEGPTVGYQGLHLTLPKGIDENDGRLIITGHQIKPSLRYRKFLGITCGCYAKFHRQIAHIEDRMKR